MSDSLREDVKLGVELISASQEASESSRDPERESQSSMNWIHKLQKGHHPLFLDIDEEASSVPVLETLLTLNVSSSVCNSSFESAVRRLGLHCDKDSLMDEALADVISVHIEMQRKGYPSLADEGSARVGELRASACTSASSKGLQKGSRSILGFLGFPTQRDDTSDSDLVNSNEFKSSFEKLPLSCQDEIDELMSKPSDQLDAEGILNRVMSCYHNMCNKRNVTPIENLLCLSTGPGRDAISIELNCSEHALKRAHTQIIQRILSICPNIKRIALDNCALNLKNFAHLAHSIHNYCRNIESLSIKGNNELCGMGMKHLQPIFSNSRLESLNLSLIQFKMTGILYLALSVNIAKNLVHLILDDCDLSESTFGALVLQIKLKPPTRVSLRNNKLGAASAPLIACLLDSDFGGERLGLKQLDLAENNLGNSIGIISTSLRTNRHLEYLNLSNNGSINSQNLQRLSSALIENKALKELHLSGTILRKSPRALDNSLPDIIKFNTSLHSLHINKTGIGSSELSQIAQAITVNQTIKYLDLSSNNFSLPPLIELEHCIEINKSLERIQILPNNNEDFLRDPIKTATILSCIEESLERNRRNAAKNENIPTTSVPL